MHALSSLTWTVLALLVVAAAVRFRARMRELHARPPRLDDDAIRAIEEEGVFYREEEPPLDLDEIEEEERRFWEEERWDGSDEGWG